MKVLFWGTPAFAVPSLRALDDEGFEVVGVVTRPDRPAGRGRRLKGSAVKEVAEEQGLELVTPASPKDDGFLEHIGRLEPDISVVVAYGHILRAEVLDLPPLGSINVHASLLPALRGAAPIHWAIARGLEETGVTVMRMVQAMDAGPVIHQVREPILPDETGSELSVRLSELGAQALVEALTLMPTGQVEEVDQDHEAATFAPKVDRATARIDWSRPARDVALHVRAMDETPGAWSMLGTDAVKLFRPTVAEATGVDGSASAGTVLATDPGTGVLVAAGEGAVLLGEVQPPGRRRMRASDWISGRRVAPGQRFE